MKKVGSSGESPVDRVLDGLRGFGAHYTEFTRGFAAHLGLHATDAAALVEILYAEDHGEPLSPARLSERISLTSGATTALLHRLERAGHIVRTREHSDRRIVTLRSSPEIQGPGREYFGPLAEHLGAMLAKYPAAEIARFEAFLADLQSTMDTVLAEQQH
ncbi:MarR family winged helix-turn-helix transcriptional regulator [Amycolatopsis sp. 195334CR]|uniref:MarR family winged helix-turn-helix transcriptional regulator n=1 Tax=Amycolatopsis sp. 195334CR TaxID=2814588 RepID=UPI001A8E6DFA|nr:MarR family transcriptional regulator [Amycolatopsis sp. 195334CR]MBN6037660.1 MarR family transcriptional regulator [Amycolatopsis sp. 195334CR]